jgi:hypothetical protein
MLILDFCEGIKLRCSPLLISSCPHTPTPASAPSSLTFFSRASKNCLRDRTSRAP